MPPDGSAGVCAWATHFDSCMLPPTPTRSLVLTASAIHWRFDSHGGGTFVGTQPPPMTFVTRTLPQFGGGPDVLVLYTQAFTIENGATLDVSGDKPLVIASDSTISIAGRLNAGSQGRASGSSNSGPGANKPGCSNGLDGSNSGDGGGGGGGALAAIAGVGGPGNGGAGGNSGSVIALASYIRGGCPGGKGGRSDGGAGGDGGGAIELAARVSILVTGTINAGGAGGDGARDQHASGGGGGGSGGVISFDSPSVTLVAGAVAAANGGGGGGGVDDESSASPGSDGAVGAGNASGGSSGISQIGGAGGASNPLTGAPGTGGGNGGGGGGGGSTGYVMVHATTFMATGATVSPPVTLR